MARPHRTARRKEAKTIQDARELIIVMVPAGYRVHLHASYSLCRDSRYSSSSERYSCSIYSNAFDQVVDADAPTPAGLVAAVHRQLQEPPRPKPSPVSKSLVPVKPPLEGEIVEEDEEFEFRSSTPRPRLPARQPPLLSYGG